MNTSGNNNELSTFSHYVIDFDHFIIRRSFGKNYISKKALIEVVDTLKAVA